MQCVQNKILLHIHAFTSHLSHCQQMYCVISRAITPVPVACCSFDNFSFSLSRASTEKSPRIMYVIVMGSHFFSFPLNQCFFLNLATLRYENFNSWSSPASWEFWEFMSTHLKLAKLKKHNSKICPYLPEVMNWISYYCLLLIT